MGLVSKQIGAILTILGGVFYIFGSLVETFIAGLLLSFFPSPAGVRPGNFTDVVLAALSFGIFSGALIIAGGAMLNSDKPDLRKSGGILAIAMMVLGALPALGGFAVGFVFTLVGSVIGLTYKPPDMVVGYMPVSAPLPAPVPAASPQGQAGPPRFCTKCGTGLHEGALFCGSCGAQIPGS